MLDQGRADPPALVLGQDGQRGQPHPDGPGIDGHRAEEDVPDDALAVHGHERDQVRARLPEAVDDPRFDRAFEGGRVEVANRSGVPVPLLAYRDQVHHLPEKIVHEPDIA